MSKLKEIIDGHVNELKSLVGVEDVEDSKVFDKRAIICSSCPLKTGNTCNPKKYLNPQTMEVSERPRRGFYKGCGCRLSAKQKSKNSKCPAGLWGGEFNK